VPLFSFLCEKCGESEDHVVFQSDKEDVVCGKCGTVMMKAFPDSMRFKLLYNPLRDTTGWSNDGYARTQRFREYDKQCKNNIFVQPGVGRSDGSIQEVSS